MAERIVLRQNSRFETEIRAADPQEPEREELNLVHAIHEVSPYAMLLISLAACTAIVVHTYAQNHKLDLEWVELRLAFDREFDEDCQNCLEIEQYNEIVTEEIVLTGSLSEQQRQKLLMVAHHCPIQKMVAAGLPVRTSLAED